MFSDAHDTTESLIEEYQLAGLDNSNELLGNFTFQQIFNVLIDCINQRKFSKWCMIMGVIETDWLKVAQSPEEFEASLEALKESEQEGETMNVEFFRQFEMRVHPQFIVNKLESLRFSASRQTLLHVAMAAYRANPESKNNVGMKFIESLLKNKFSMFVTDSE